MGDIPKTLRIKINTMWCGQCGRFVGVQNGTCVVCNARLADELKKKQQPETEVLDG